MTISQQEITKRLDYFRQVVKDKHLPITPQKLEIFRIIASSCKHPNVQEIHKQVKKKFDSISLATVYKNLIGFKELGLIAEIPLSGTPNRYDAKLETHGHVVDTKSGQVYDLGENKNLNLPLIIMGKKLKKADIIYYI